MYILLQKKLVRLAGRSGVTDNVGTTSECKMTQQFSERENQRQITVSVKFYLSEELNHFMKNKVFKKVLSVFLSLLMIMAYFGSFSVFMPITAKALPATVDTYVKTDAYGTPKWNANADRWFKWAYNSDYVKVHYPSNIYLDVTETLQSAGYYFNVEWHFGDSSNYRVLLGAPIWGDYTAYSGYPSAYYTMTNIFSDYKVDAELPTNAPAGLYGKTNSSTNFDLRIVGYGWDGQGSDGFTFNNVRHDKYVLWRNNVNRTDPMYTKIFLMGTPSSSASGKTQAFNTSGGDIASFGLLQQYNSGWGNADSRHMFNKKGTGGQSSQSAVDCSNYTEYSNGTYWPEMAWNVTVYDKSSLKNEINKAADLINRFAGSKDKIVAGNWDTFLAENSQAENQIIIREQTQSNINTAKNELYNAAYALYIGADKSELTTAINQANAIRNAADYTAKYSEASRQALDNAVNAALSAAVYASTPTYHLYTNNDAANLVAADQNEIARLTSDINLAKANLVGTLYELTFKFNDGTSTLKYVWQGNEVVAPDNSTKAPDSLYHYTYTWSPAIVSPPTGNVTYTETLSYEGHNFGGWTVTMDSTCTAVGAKQRSCITCGYIETDVVEKLEHTPMAPVEKDRIEPDCITDGSYTKEIWCEKCGNMISSETVTLKATGHTFNETVNANEATCTADGNLAYKTCSVCNLYFAGDAAVNSVDGKTTNEDFILASSGHALVHFTANAAKCGVAGNIEYWRCGNCNGYYLDAAATMPTTATAVVLPAREHSYNAVKHEATCTNGEYYTYTCANCGDTKTSEEGEPLPHPYVFVKNDPAPTCTTGGTAHYECSVCKATKTESVDALGHSAVFVPFEDSTCTETGVKAHWFCAQCNTAFEDEDCTVVLDSIVVELKDHSWSDWNETLAPTCSATGLEVRECSVCHETEEQTKAIDPNAHKWNAYEDLGNGKHTRTCEYDAENHQQVVTCTYGDWMTTTQPDCLTAGEQTKTCQFCTGTATQPVAALGHTFGATVAANEATCTAKGNEAYKQCETCSLYFAADAATDAANGENEASAFDIAMLEHTYATEINRVPSTCKTAGSVTMACGCGAEQTTALELDADNHEKLVKLEAKAATCSATGLTEGEKCEACGVVTVAQTETAKLAHTEATREEDKVPATCGKDGSYTLVTYCSVCDEVIKEEEKVIPATGEHVYATEINRVPSTCKTAGSVTMACGCGAEQTTVLELDADNHEKLVKLEAKAATCSATGLTEGKKCEACGVVTVAQTETAKLAHTEATREENKVPATCGKDGSYTLVTYCSVCDEVLKEEAKTIAATGEHVYATEINRVPSTCKTAGSVTKQCGCGATETTALELDADKHEKLVKLEAKAATCSATGLTEGEKCEACGVVTVAQNETAKLAHTEATREENIVPATCGKDGSYTLVTYCSVCDEVLKKEAKVIPATGEHVYATEINRVPSTCKTAGSVTMACGCGATETTALELDANNHEKLVKLEAKAATCSATGLTEGEKCEACGVVTVAQTETAKLAHTEATREENIVPATCGKDGSYTLVTYCSVCDEVLKEEAKTIAALTHDWYEDSLLRPTQKADGTWGNGVITFVCRHDSKHTKTEIVNRADYAAYDAVVEKLNDVLADDTLSDAARAEIESILADHEVALNLVASEQNAVDEAAERMAAEAEKYIAEFTVTFVAADGTVLSEQTVKYGNNATAPEAPVVPGFVFVGWDKDFTNVRADLTVNAMYEEGSTHISLDADNIGVGIGETKKINAVLLSDEEIDTALTWTVADSTIATVDANGVVKGVRSGKTTVTVSAANGLLTEEVNVYVYNPGGEYIVELFATPYGAYVVGNKEYSAFTYFKVKAGKEFKFRFAVDEQINPEALEILVDGEKLEVGEDGYYTIPYVCADTKITVSAVGDLGNDTPVEPPVIEDDTCLCHSSNKLMQFFWKVLIFFCKLFGVENYHYCKCGKAHW